MGALSLEQVNKTCVRCAVVRRARVGVSAVRPGPRTGSDRSVTLAPYPRWAQLALYVRQKRLIGHGATAGFRG